VTALFDERRGAPPAVVAILVLAAVPAAWLATWLARGVSAPAGGGAEDFPYPAVLAIGLLAPPVVAAIVVGVTRSGWRPPEAALIAAAATLVVWLGARVLLKWPGWMPYLCTNEGTGPHLLFRRLTTVALLRRDGGLWGHDYGPGPAIAGVAALAAYFGGGFLALRNPRRALWAVPAAGLLAIMVWVALFTIIEGRPVQHCST
jgi:hypothetical protein